MSLQKRRAETLSLKTTIQEQKIYTLTICTLEKYHREIYLERNDMTISVLLGGEGGGNINLLA